MTNARNRKSQKGFTLLETMVAAAIFIVICGAMFSLLNQTQLQYNTDSQLLSSFQQARLGLDQVARDVNDAGYPPENHFSTLPAANLYVNSPIAWSPTYPATPCLIGTGGGGTCVTPGDFDVVFEGDTDGTGVKWIRYQLVGTTLMRGVVNKVAGGDPIAATAAAGVMVPYVILVMNNSTAAQIAAFRVIYPNMFPGGNPVPIFQFNCDTPNGPVLCQNAGANNSPANIRDVEITLIVRTPQVDSQTGNPRLLELNGRGHRMNPNQ